MDIEHEFQRALAFHQSGDLASAAKSYRSVLSAAPRNFDANCLLGLVYLQCGNFGQAKKQFARAVKINPKASHAFNDLGNALFELGQPKEALANYDKAVGLDPNFAEALNNRGNALAGLQRFDEAIASYYRAIRAKPDYAMAYYNCGNSLRALKKLDDAVASFDRAIAIEPRYAEAHNNRGNTLLDLGQYDAALAAYNDAISIDPSFAEAFYNRVQALTKLRRYGEALSSCEQAAALAGDLPKGQLARGDALQNLRRYGESVVAYDKALALDPDLADAWSGRAISLSNLNRHGDAVKSLEALLVVAPDYDFAKGDLALEKMSACDWNGLADLQRSIHEDIRAGKKSARPFGYQAFANSPQDIRRCAEILVNEEFPATRVPLCKGVCYSHDKVRIGYLSGEFRQQATSVLITELFELHHKRQFELFAFDNGFDDGTEIRQRINAAFDRLIDIRRMDDAKAAEEIKRNEIDILVNLNGFFGEARMGVFSYRPAPIQVNYLGFPGTLGADYIDYLVADACVIPPDEKNCYVEKVVYLPETYQVNDTKRRIAERAPTRAEAGLPETGFVFCCFNNNYKIAPETFGAWMRMLKAVDDSVLWLLADNPDAERNLRDEAARRGVSPKRLVFAPRVKLYEHLARHRLADLFLDTLPSNAHTSASDALWAGLPVLTCLGSTFPGRVAASLLQAVGMPELITPSLEEYEECALRLAREPEQLASCKMKLARSRGTCSLFDSKRFTRHIEIAYMTMYRRLQDGNPPAGFSIASL